MVCKMADQRAWSTDICFAGSATSPWSHHWRRWCHCKLLRLISDIMAHDQAGHQRREVNITGLSSSLLKVHAIFSHSSPGGNQSLHGKPIWLQQHIWAEPLFKVSSSSTIHLTTFNAGTVRC